MDEDKERVKVELDAELVATARKLGLDVERLVSEALCAVIRSEKARRSWAEDAASALEEEARRHSQDGDPLARFRRY